MFQQKKVVFTVGGTASYRLGKRMPDGIILGTRGPYGILVRGRDTELNNWFVNTARIVTAHSRPARLTSTVKPFWRQAVAFDRAAGSSRRLPDARSGDRHVRRHGLRELLDHREDGDRQRSPRAVTESVYGISKWDEDNAEAGAENIQFFPASCVMPPEGVSSVEWIEGGMQGAKC